MRIIHFKNFSGLLRPLTCVRPSRPAVCSTRAVQGLQGNRLGAGLLQTLHTLSENSQYRCRPLAEILLHHLTDVTADRPFGDVGINPFDFFKALLDGRRQLFDDVVGSEAPLSEEAMVLKVNLVNDQARKLVLDLRKRLVQAEVPHDLGRIFFTAFDTMVSHVLSTIPSAVVAHRGPRGQFVNRMVVSFFRRGTDAPWPEFLRRTEKDISGALDLVHSAYQTDPGAFFKYFSLNL